MNLESIESNYFNPKLLDKTIFFTVCLGIVGQVRCGEVGLGGEGGEGCLLRCGS